MRTSSSSRSWASVHGPAFRAASQPEGGDAGHPPARPARRDHQRERVPQAGTSERRKGRRSEPDRGWVVRRPQDTSGESPCRVINRAGGGYRYNAPYAGSAETDTPPIGPNTSSWRPEKSPELLVISARARSVPHQRPPPRYRPFASPMLASIRWSRGRSPSPPLRALPARPTASVRERPVALRVATHRPVMLVRPASCDRCVAVGVPAARPRAAAPDPRVRRVGRHDQTCASRREERLSCGGRPRTRIRRQRRRSAGRSSDHDRLPPAAATDAVCPPDKPHCPTSLFSRGCADLGERAQLWLAYRAEQRESRRCVVARATTSATAPTESLRSVGGYR